MVFGNSSDAGLPPTAGDISPVTLSSDWSRVVRLLLVVGLAVVGSIGNVYMISAVMIEDYLKRRGNAFIVNIALADLLITGVVMPASAVVILAGLQDSPVVCQCQWFLAILCWLVTVLSLAAAAAESYVRLCLSPEWYATLTTKNITATILLIWMACGTADVVQFIYDLGPDYCRRRFSGVVPYQATVAILFVVIPAVLTFTLYMRIILQLHVARKHPGFKPPVQFSWDYSLMKTNMYSFFLFFLFWLPFGIILGVGSIQDISPRTFYNLAWLALSKSCINNLLYCIANRHFRVAYNNLFHYCCCKTTVAFSRRPRADGTRPTGDVRVHIIPGYNMYSYTSPQRTRDSSSGGKRSGGMSRSNRTNGRDVYEL